MAKDLKHRVPGYQKKPKLAQWRLGLAVALLAGLAVLVLVRYFLNPGPADSAPEITSVAALPDPHFTFELTRSNLEINLDPRPLEGSCFSEMHRQLNTLLDQGQEVRLLEGEVGGDCIYGYFKGDDMVGVCGIGMRSKVMGYRNKVGLSAS